MTNDPRAWRRCWLLGISIMLAVLLAATFAPRISAQEVRDFFQQEYEWRQRLDSQETQVRPLRKHRVRISKRTTSHASQTIAPTVATPPASTQLPARDFPSRGLVEEWQDWLEPEVILAAAAAIAVLGALWLLLRLRPGAARQVRELQVGLSKLLAETDATKAEILHLRTQLDKLLELNARLYRAATEVGGDRGAPAISLHPRRSAVEASSAGT